MKSVSIAAESEDRLELLRAMRAKVAWELDNASCTRDVEPVSRRLQSIAAEIDELAPSVQCAADQIAARRAQRREQRRARKPRGGGAIA